MEDQIHTAGYMKIVDEADQAPVEATETILPVEIKPAVKKNNTLARFKRSRERVFVKHGMTYNVGKNKAKRERNGK